MTGDAWSLPRLRIDRSGDWFDGDQPITHPGILARLRAGLERDAGGHFVRTRLRIPVEVEDAPFVVTRVERRDEGLRVCLNDGSECDVDPATLGFGPGNVPYCTVKDGGFTARLDRAAAYQLLQLAVPDAPDGAVTLRLGARTVAVTRR